MRFGTKVIHAGLHADPATGAIMTPIYQTSTYKQIAPNEHKGYAYARTSNPTRTALQDNIAALENANYGIAFASGMAAIDAVSRLLKPGDEIIANSDLYGGTYRLLVNCLAPYGIKMHFIPINEASDVKPYLNDQTKLLWIETPSNPLLSIIDIKSIADLLKDHEAYLAVDNTFATPFLQNPLDLGADIVVHSATKYLGGHSDVIIGVVAVNDESIKDRLTFLQKSAGAVPGPMDCFLTLRGIKTLVVRMQRHCENATHIAHFLDNHPKVNKVFWPGLSTHPNHHIAAKQMKNFGGMLSFTLHNDTLEAAIKLMANTEIFSLAESLGGVESLIGHPASMTHAAIPTNERQKIGVLDSLIRLSIGIEDYNDLIEDLSQALDKL
jgi:cystathionine gamma-lyase